MVAPMQGGKDRIGLLAHVNGYDVRKASMHAYSKVNLSVFSEAYSQGRGHTTASLVLCSESANNSYKNEGIFRSKGSRITPPPLKKNNPKHSPRNNAILKNTSQVLL